MSRASSRRDARLAWIRFGFFAPSNKYTLKPIVLAISAAGKTGRVVREKQMGNGNKTNDPVKHYTGVGAALGLAFGAAFGAAFDDAGTGVALGLALGVAIGAGIGTSLKKKQDTDDSNK